MASSIINDTMPFDFEAAVSSPFRMQPGLRRMTQDAVQLTPVSAGSRHQREKLAVLSAQPGMALQSVAGFDAQPALHVLAAQAAIEHPTVFSWDGRCAQALGVQVQVQGGQVEQLAGGSFGLGDEVGRCLQGLAPEWRLAGLLCLAFAEDLALVDTQAGTLPWLAVALPSHWAPAEKIGRHFTEVHAPVADNTLLLKAAPSLMQLVAGPARWERFVWNVTSHPRLNAHPAHVDAVRWPMPFNPTSAWWRSEHQTFIPLNPQPGQPSLAVFTIHVDVQPLASVVHSAARAQLLAQAVGSMSPAVLAYRSLAAVQAPLLAWLARRVAAG